MNTRAVFEDYIVNNIDDVYRFAYTYVKNPSLSEDVVNDSVVKAITKISTLKNEEYVKAWFFRIVANTAISYLRKEKKIVNSDKDVPVDDNHADLSFFSMISNLDVKYREVVVLRFLEDMSLKEIAIVLNEKENTVKTRLYRALELLRVEIKEDCL